MSVQSVMSVVCVRANLVLLLLMLLLWLSLMLFQQHTSHLRHLNMSVVIQAIWIWDLEVMPPTPLSNHFIVACVVWTSEQLYNIIISIIKFSLMANGGRKCSARNDDSQFMYTYLYAHWNTPFLTVQHTYICM